MISAIWPGQGFVVTTVCVTLGALALAFFVVIFVADAREAKRKAEAARVLREFRKQDAVCENTSDVEGM